VLPACVPGAWGAWLRLLAEYGTMRLGAVLDFGIGCAADGCPVVPDTATAIAALAPLFASEWAESGRTYLVGGRPPAPGSRLRNEGLADTMRRLLH
jgi:gamma-glutamyltranspeptidase / glutathione hydrolase